MMEEQPKPKKSFASFMNKVYQIIILNIITFITIVLGLGIFSLFPALVSLLAMLKNGNDETFIGMFKLYFRTLKKIYWKAFSVSLVFFVLLFLGAFSTFYFYCFTLESTNIFFALAYYLMLFVEAVFLLATINANFMIVYYPHLKFFKIIKYAFKTLLVVTLRALIIFILLIGAVYLGVLFVPALPIFLISLFMFICLKLLDKPYTKLIPKDKKTLNPYDC